MQLTTSLRGRRTKGKEGDLNASAKRDRWGLDISQLTGRNEENNSVIAGAPYETPTIALRARIQLPPPSPLYAGHAG